MKILVLDDDLASVKYSVKTLEKLYGEGSITVIEDEEEGIKKSTFNYDVIFIDFKFSADPSRKTGNQVGMAIRRKNPLSALILMTAHSKDRIRDFIYVGFDDYIEKDVRTTDYEQMFKNVVEKAIENSQNRLKSRFTEEELADERAALDRFEALVNAGFTKVIQLAPGENILRPSPEFYDNTSKSINPDKVKELNELLINAPKLPKFKLYNQQKKKSEEHKLNNQTSLNEHFKVYRKGLFVAEERALKARQLLMENPQEWPKFRKCSPLVGYNGKKGFLSHFNIG